MVNPTYHNNVAIDTLLSHVGADAHIGPPCAGLAHLPYELFCICFLVLPPAGPCDGSLLAAKPLRFRFPPP